MAAVAALAAVAAIGGCGGDDGPAPPPERAAAFFVSHVFVSTKKHPPGEARVLARRAEETIRAGTPFADVARARTEDDSGPDGGFLGYVQTHHDTAFAGAVQMLGEGELAGPVRTAIGWQVLYRHPYEEGRALERRHRIATFGFFLTWAEIDPSQSRSREDALALATRLVAEIRDGRTTVGEARARHAPAGVGRPDGWLRLLPRRPATAAVYDALAGLPDGGVPDPVETNEGFGVLQRGSFFRCAVRHLLVQHIASESRSPNVRRAPPEAERLARQALSEARPDDGAWRELVARVSDDVTTVADGGSLGVVGNGELDPALEAAILATQPGRIHASVVQTALGYHVLWRVD
jgi:hypothetical protein